MQETVPIAPERVLTEAERDEENAKLARANAGCADGRIDRADLLAVVGGMRIISADELVPAARRTA